MSFSSNFNILDSLFYLINFTSFSLRSCCEKSNFFIQSFKILSS